MQKKIFPAFLLVLSGVTQGCISDPLTVSGGGEIQALLHVTGGLAGADYSVFLDGDARSLVGVSCVSLCEFQNGEVLQSLTKEQVGYLWGLFREAEVLAMDGQDFGIQCCDQFHFDLDYQDGDGRSRVKGSSEVLPPKLKVAVATLQGMVSGTLPVIVAFETAPELWPNAPFQIQEAAVHGHELQVRLAYGGGCRTHDVKAVAWGGWMEADPVQVRLFLAHEDFNDPCDAWITREFRFDLVPLKLAYEGSYGIGDPGTTTLILLLADPMLAGPLGARWIEYRF